MTLPPDQRAPLLAEASATLARVTSVEAPGDGSGAAGAPQLEEVQTLLRPPGDPERAATALRARIQFADALLGGRAPVDVTAADRALNELGRRSESARPDSGLWQSILNALRVGVFEPIWDRVIVPLWRWFTDSDSPSGGVLSFGGIAAVVAVAAVVTLFLRGALAPKQRPDEAPVIASGTPRARAEQQLAEAAAAAGDYRRALHHLYLALLYELDRADQLRFDPSLTNRELVARSGAGADLVALVDRYDATWYGNADVTAEEYARFRAAVARLLPATAGPTPTPTPTGASAA